MEVEKEKLADPRSTILDSTVGYDQKSVSILGDSI